MNEKLIFKALANDTRRQILAWLKNPKQHFPAALSDVVRDGVCCGLIQQKAGLAQSTVCHYLGLLEQAGLVTTTRSGQWTLYKRNEVVIAQFIAKLAASL
ncbi:MAG: hlyU [Gammaproteobacteria bacterium]|jgi:ArsR family transcriptional regulator|nr:hlyU [Gammaproteobacteria bacterium]